MRLGLSFLGWGVAPQPPGAGRVGPSVPVPKGLWGVVGLVLLLPRPVSPPAIKCVCPWLAPSLSVPVDRGLAGCVCVQQGRGTVAESPCPQRGDPDPFHVGCGRRQ